VETNGTPPVDTVTDGDTAAGAPAGVVLRFIPDGAAVLEPQAEAAVAQEAPVAPLALDVAALERDLERDIDTALEAIEAATRQRQADLETIAGLRAENENFLREQATLVETLGATTSELERTRATLRDLEAEVARAAAAQGTLEAAEEQKASLQEENARLQAQVGERDRQILDLQAENARLDGALRREVRGAMLRGATEGLKRVL
jgi:chromosome segregation ATPase